MASLGRVYSLEEILKLTIPILKAHNIERARVFGSYARGEQTARSDLDLLVKSDLRGLKFGGLLADFFDVFGYGTVDLYDEREIVPGTEFERSITSEGIVIYENK